MNIFDPTGILTLLIINSRILSQNICRHATHWVQEITENSFQASLKQLKQIRTLTSATMHRNYFPIQTVVKKLFCDASDKAYAAVAFFRADSSDNVCTALVAAKYKVAPMNQQTIPKLELQDAVFP